MSQQPPIHSEEQTKYEFIENSHIANLILKELEQSEVFTEPERRALATTITKALTMLESQITNKLGELLNSDEF